MTEQQSPGDGSLRIYEPLENESSRAVRFMIWASFIALLLVPVVTLIDVPIARWFDGDPFPSDVDNAIQLTEAYSHGIGVLFIVIGILTLTPQHRWCTPRLTTMALGASAVATIVKMFVLRPRPSAINLQLASGDAAWWWRFDWKLEQVAAFDAGTRAFPSGGTATAVALTVGLSMLFPRGRYLFVVFAVLTMLQRMQSDAHFFSDAIGGLAFGLAWSVVCLHPRLLGALFDHMEPESLSKRPTGSAEPRQAA
ncbi:phosphatase PAP2 family protein [Roseimaritima sediminicola]|uniref:phosphatase PAP2 family protein n=1 Tax=Roseimaritima sediminicola TaxID=2662066 RepID=UPI0013872296|nr:phosphatase PAP2 family protein [Roseimaritima sediminicola]